MDVESVLCDLLDRVPDAIVAAIGESGELVRVPASVPLVAHHPYEGRSALQLIVPEDHRLVIEAWKDSRETAVVRFPVHFLADPDHIAVVHLLDVRDTHGVRMLVAECDDIDAMLQSAELRNALRPSVGHAQRDAIGTFIEVDGDMTRLLGWDRDELLGRSTLDLVHPDDAPRAIDMWLDMRSEGGTRRSRLRLRHSRGHYVWVEVTNENHLDDPAVGCVASQFVDISAEMSQLEDLHDRERLLARQAAALPIGLCHFRSVDDVAYSNRAFVDLVGPVTDLRHLVVCISVTDRPAVEAAVLGAFDGATTTLEVETRSFSGPRRCELTMNPLEDEEGGIEGVIVGAVDVTDRARLRGELEYRASHDALTGCLNRGATITAVEDALRDGVAVVMAFIDLDAFKWVNDEVGHAAGDELLRVAAQRLRGAMRDTDILGRFGGDEFVVAATVPRDEPVDVASFAERLADAVTGDVVFAGRRIPLRASVGAAVDVTCEVDVEALLRRADAAMYAAKRGLTARRSTC